MLSNISTSPPNILYDDFSVSIIKINASLLRFVTYILSSIWIYLLFSLSDLYYFIIISYSLIYS
jgi:hypothetical protein